LHYFAITLSTDTLISWILLIHYIENWLLRLSWDIHW
jgi:hypothetical protein